MQTLNQILFGTDDPNPLVAEGEQAKNELLKAGRLMQELIATDGWKTLEEYFLKRQEQHSRMMLEPIRDQSQLYFQECNKGAIHALAWAVSLPSVIIQASKEIQEGRKAAGNGKEVKHAPLAP